MTEPIRVLIADDHPLFRYGLTALLTDSPDTELGGARDEPRAAWDTSPGSEGHPPAASPFRRPVSRLFPALS